MRQWMRKFARLLILRLVRSRALTAPLHTDNAIWRCAPRSRRSKPNFYNQASIPGIIKGIYFFRSDIFLDKRVVRVSACSEELILLASRNDHFFDRPGLRLKNSETHALIEFEDVIDTPNTLFPPFDLDL